MREMRARASGTQGGKKYDVNHWILKWRACRLVMFYRDTVLSSILWN